MALIVISPGYFYCRFTGIRHFSNRKFQETNQTSKCSFLTLSFLTKIDLSKQKTRDNIRWNLVGGCFLSNGSPDLIKISPKIDA